MISDALPDQENGRITFKDFTTLFSPPVIQVRLAWDMLDKLNPVINVISLSSLRGIADQWIVPWYVSESKQVPYDHPQARPLRLADIAADLSWLEPWRQAVITTLASDFSRSGAPVSFLMATYRVRGTELILDGNHRAVAAYLQNSECRALALSLDGPCDKSYLPDLRHWGS